MQQLVQSPRNGEVKVQETPFPALNPGYVLVRNHYSVLSASTESRRPHEFRQDVFEQAGVQTQDMGQVVASMKKMGLAATYQRLMNRLEIPVVLGYSCAGEVLDVGSGVQSFNVGDRVACAGGTAIHAEVVSVPANLCVQVPREVDLQLAAFTTLGAIALQGVRRTQLGLGSNCVVIGLGLTGLITLQLLEASGVQAIGIDGDPDRLVLARRIGVGKIAHRDDPVLEKMVLERSRGAGTDAVIITADPSHDPLELAGVLCRKKGNVVVVGNMPAGFSRTMYFQKELDLLMSSSYGPGMYERQYEEKGIDYPIGHVRWTENRNMQAFVDLLLREKLQIQPLISHTFPLESAKEAYQIVLQNTESFAGVVLKYDTEKTVTTRVSLKYQYRSDERVNIGVIGGGTFLEQALLPVLSGKGTMIGIASSHPHNGRSMAEKFGFDYCTGDADEIMGDDRINTIFISSRHDLHAPLAMKAMQSGKHVYVDKPLCLNLEELEHLQSRYMNIPMQLTVGFSRRCSPHVQQVKKMLSPDVPVAINYRINANTLPADHWLHDVEQGGGHIVGEVCQYVDLVQFLTGAPVTSLAAHALTDHERLNDTLTINLGFSNGSTATIAYFSNGNKRLARERLEVFSAGTVAVIEDFKTMTLYGERYNTYRLRKQDIGYSNHIDAFLHAIRSGLEGPISFEEIAMTMRTTFNIEESIQRHQMISA